MRKDIPGVGKNTERIKVSDAYARNVLIPRGWAIVGEQSAYQVATKELIDMQAVSKALSQPIQFSVSANEKGRLYKKIHKQDIALQVANRLHIAASHIQPTLEKQLDHVGSFQLSVDIYGKIFPITVNIAAQ